MTSLRSLMFPCAGVLALAVAFLSAGAADAKIDGHPGVAGRTGTCGECHGDKGYENGINFALASGATECWIPGSDGTTLEKSQVWTAQLGQTVDLVITVNEPPSPPSCPTPAACCAGTTPETVCATGSPEEQTCGLPPCGAPLIGFGAEVFPSGAFKASDAETRVPGDVQGGTPDPTQIVHAAPKTFEGGKATWNVKLTMPASADLLVDDPSTELDEKGLQAVNVYVGGNVTNGNGLADLEDLNINYRDSIFLTDGKAPPPVCASCPNGLPINPDGSCPACACAALPSSTGLWGAACVGLLALVVGRRRRR